MKDNNWFYIILMCLVLAACKTGNKIELFYGGGMVTVKGIDAVTLGGLKRDTLSQEAWNNLFPVRQMPADEDLKDDQTPVAGTYTVSDTDITFKPDTAFKKGARYFARYYRYDKEISYWDLIFKRREMGKADYTELVFSPLTP